MSATALVSAVRFGGRVPRMIQGPTCLTEIMTMEANYDELRRKMIRETEEYLEQRLTAKAEAVATEPVAVLREQPIESRSAIAAFGGLALHREVSPSHLMFDQSCTDSA